MNRRWGGRGAALVVLLSVAATVLATPAQAADSTIAAFTLKSLRSVTEFAPGRMLYALARKF